MKHALVTGAGGFIGGHLVKALLAQGRLVTAADIKLAEDWHQLHDSAANVTGIDLNNQRMCADWLPRKYDECYHLAADMGGMGFIENFKAACMLNVQNSVNMLLHARSAGASRYFYASTACVYRHDMQDKAVPDRGLREDDAYPADPEDGYGWEKLFSERMARHFREDYGLETRVARFHTVYGPHETWDGGREKAPAALARKIALAKIRDEEEIDVWGDGEQGRSFLYVDDAVRGLLAVAGGSCHDPLNVGSPELISINDLAALLMDIAGYRVRLRHVPGPLGVRGRYADLANVTALTGWKPETSLRDGMTVMYNWIEEQVRTRL